MLVFTYKLHVPEKVLLAFNSLNIVLTLKNSLVFSPVAAQQFVLKGSVTSSAVLEVILRVPAVIAFFLLVRISNWYVPF